MSAAERARRPWGRDVIALAIAIAVNASLFLALAQLNGAQAPPPSEPLATLQWVALPALLPRSEPVTPSPESQPETDSAPIRVNFDMPTPEMPVAEPIAMDLAINIPDPAAVRVAVRRQTPVSTKSSNRPQERRGTVAVGLSERPNNPRPVYPRQARRRGIEGTVTVRLTVDAHGRVEKAEVLAGHPLLRQAVEAVVDAYRFDPPRHQGRPMRAIGIKTFRFELEN